MSKKDKPLTSIQIGNNLLALSQRELDEKIRSNKVIEGILYDISNGIDRIASNLENKV